MKLLIATLLVIAAAIVALMACRRSDERKLERAWRRLECSRSSMPETFDPMLIESLPRPAQRYFLYAIRPGTRTRTVARIHMHGEISLGSKDSPNYLPMRALELLAPPFGFVWRVAAGHGLMRFAGSDGLDQASSWSRFWLFGLLPIGRAAGGEDHRRAALGRLVGEAVFWTPAALLPRTGIRWSAVDDATARATVELDGLTQTVDVTVADDGRPTQIVLPRWTNANPDKIFRLQPFGGYLDEFRDFEGYRLPTRIEAGNFFGTEDYFPFFKARVDNIQFIAAEDGTGSP